MATSIENVRQIQNPQKAYEWEVEILGPSTGGEEGLTARAQTVNIPETSTDTIEINHKSEKTTHPGRVASARTMNINFFDDENLTVYRFMKAWSQLVHNENTGGGADRVSVMANIIVRQLHADSETESAVHTIGGAFPTTIGEISLSYDSSEHMVVDVTFAFQTNNVN